jgi:hypothetical protein
MGQLPELRECLDQRHSQGVGSFSEETTMAVIVTLSAATACLLLFQAIHILKSGDTQMFFLTRKPRSVPGQTGSSRRVAGALMYGVPAGAILVLLAFAAIKNGKLAILSWLSADSGNLVGGVILFTFGLIALVWPDWILKGVQAAYPNADLGMNGGFGAALTRVLGTVLLGFGLLVLSVLRRTG